MNETEKRNLLLSAGVDPETGRKIRSDKGTKRGPNSKVRSDKGTKRGPNSTIRSDKGYKRPTKERSKITVYLALKGRILNSTVYDETQPDYCLRIDENMLFIPMIKHNTVKQQNYTIVSKGLAKQRTCKHIQGYEIDLESYRFEALQELALNFPNELIAESQYNIKFAAEVSQLVNLYGSDIVNKATITWWDLFCLLYHILGEDVAKWTYQQWHQQYEIAQTYYNQTYGDDVPLSSDFTFEFGKKLGTDYWTEMSSVSQSMKTTQINEIKASRDYLVYMAKVRVVRVESGSCYAPESP